MAMMLHMMMEAQEGNPDTGRTSTINLKASQSLFFNETSSYVWVDLFAI